MARLRGKSGFSLIELAIVMTIIGIISAGIWLLSSEAMTNHKTQILLRDSLQIIQNARAFFSDYQDEVNDFTSDEAITAGIFPPNWILSRSGSMIIKHPFSTNYQSRSAELMAQANMIYFWVGGTGSEATGLPQAACIKLAVMYANTNNISKLGFRRIDINSPEGANRYIAPNFPTLAQIASNCTATNRNSVQVYFDPT